MKMPKGCSAALSLFLGQVEISEVELPDPFVAASRHGKEMVVCLTTFSFVSAFHPVVIGEFPLIRLRKQKTLGKEEIRFLGRVFALLPLFFRFLFPETEKG